jgi:hypothetical protein
MVREVRVVACVLWECVDGPLFHRLAIAHFLLRAVALHQVARSRAVPHREQRSGPSVSPLRADRRDGVPPQVDDRVPSLYSVIRYHSGVRHCLGSRCPPRNERPSESAPSCVKFSRDAHLASSRSSRVPRRGQHPTGHAEPRRPGWLVSEPAPVSLGAASPDDRLHRDFPHLPPTAAALSLTRRASRPASSTPPRPSPPRMKSARSSCKIAVRTICSS